jgi:hypothetical protein
MTHVCEHVVRVATALILAVLATSCGREEQPGVCVAASCGADVQPAICQRYIGCLGAFYPDALAVELSAYGPDGLCWDSDDATRAACTQACQTAFDADCHM